MVSNPGRQLGVPGVQVRVAPPHLRFDRAGDIFGAEVAGLLTDGDLEGEVEHEIAEFVPDFDQVASGNRLVQLEDLFYQIGAERFTGLGGIPGAAFSEIPDQLDHASKR